MKEEISVRQKAILFNMSIQTQIYQRLEILLKGEKENDCKEEDKTLKYYDKDKYRDMILDAAETVLRLFGFDRTVYGMPRENRKRKWYNELHEERTKDIQTEMMMEKQ